MSQDGKSDPPANEQLRRPAPKVIDQRQQQIDPAGHHREDHNARPPGNRKQPGGGVTDRTGPTDTGPTDIGPTDHEDRND